MIAADIHEVYVATRPQGDVTYMETVVVLKARDQQRYLPLWIAYPQAVDIARDLRGPQMPHRPFTYELMAQLIERLGARLEAVGIASLEGNTYRATLRLAVNDRLEDVDCRPSDALSLALSANAPIWIGEDVLAREGHEEPTRFAVGGVVQPLELAGLGA